MKKRIIFILLLLCPFIMQAQEVFVNADFVSNYIWRGMKCGNASVQPTLGVWEISLFRHGDLLNFAMKTTR